MGAPSLCDECARDGFPGHNAARQDHVECLKEYYKDNAHPVNLAGPEDKYTPLHWAALKGHVQSVRALLWLGAAVDSLEKSGWSPLHLACMRGHDPVVKILVVHGANAELVDKRNSTAIHKAASAGSLSCLQTLLKRNPRIDMRDSLGWMPIHCAAFSGRLSCIQYLHRCGASVIEADEVGDTPLHLAVSEGYGECAKLLMTMGADATAKNTDGETARDVAGRLGQDEVLTHLDLFEIEQKIARLQAGLEEYDDESIGPCDACHSTHYSVHAAAYSGHLLCLRREVAWHNGDISAVDDEGFQPIHRAAGAGHLHCIRWLLSQGVYAFARTREELKTPRDLARENRHFDCVEFLPQNEEEPNDAMADDQVEDERSEEEVPITEKLNKLQRQLDEEKERYARLQVVLEASGGDGLASLLEHERAKRENLEGLLEHLREQLTRASALPPMAQRNSVASMSVPPMQQSGSSFSVGRMLSRPQSARTQSISVAARSPRGSTVMTTPLKWSIAQPDGILSASAASTPRKASVVETSAPGSSSPGKKRKSKKKHNTPGAIFTKEPRRPSEVLASPPSRYSR
eukprot:Opistho-2@7652